MRVHPQAAVLGAPLEAGKDLYPELQGTYKQTTGHNYVISQEALCFSWPSLMARPENN